MKKVINIFNFYVFSNIHVGVAAYSFTKISLLFIGNTSDIIPLWLFFATITAYNLIRIIDFDLLSTEYSNSWYFINIHKVLFSTYIAIIGFLIVSFFVNINVLLWYVLVGLIASFYVIPIFRFKNIFYSIREIPYIKIIFVVVIWTLATVIIPIEATIPDIIFNKLMVYVIFRFLLYITLIIPFEIRDVNYDNESLKTLPQFVGVTNSKLIGVFLLTGIGIINYSYIYNDVIITTVILIIAALLIVFSTVKQSVYYSSFWVESLPIIWLFLILLN